MDPPLGNVPSHGPQHLKLQRARSSRGWGTKVPGSGSMEATEDMVEAWRPSRHEEAIKAVEAAEAAEAKEAAEGIAIEKS